jgi:hypothetical protein
MINSRVPDKSGTGEKKCLILYSCYYFFYFCTRKLRIDDSLAGDAPRGMINETKENDKL